MSTTNWTPRPGDPCPPDRYTVAGPHAFVDEDELARRRARWHAMNNAPPPEKDEAPEAATAGASEGTDENTTSGPDAAPPAAGYAHGPLALGMDPVRWALAQNARKAGAKLVLVVMASYCRWQSDRNNDNCWPSADEIAERANMGRTAVLENVDRLEALGLIHDTGKRQGRTRQITVWCLGSSPESTPFNEPDSESLPRKGSGKSGKGSGIRAERVRNPDTEHPRNPTEGGFVGERAAHADGGLAPAAAAAPSMVYPVIGSAALWVKLHTSRKRTATQADFDAWGEQAQAALADGCDVDQGIQALINNRHHRDFPWVGGPQTFAPRVSRPRRKAAAAFPKNTRAPGRTYD